VPIGFPLVPVAAAVLPNGKVLTWSSYAPDTFGGTGKTVTATYDIATGVVTQRTVTETGHDMFCPGIAMLPDGRVLVAGGDGSGSTTPAGDRGQDGDAMTGDAVMYDAGKILTVGGSPSYQNSAATANAHVITLNGGNATVRQVAPMANARAFANSVVLPDGKVAVFGGQNYAAPFSDNTAVLSPELWDPASETFTALTPSVVPRTYHSVAVLLPDGRVFTGGGGLCGGCSTNHLDAEIFTPPNLLNPDGTPA